MPSSLNWSEGTVTVTAGSPAVTGVATGWAVALVKGGMFTRNGFSVPIDDVLSDTELVLAAAAPAGMAGLGVTYVISRPHSEAVRAAWTNDRLVNIIQKLALVGIKPAGSGTIAERNAMNPQPATGELFLEAVVDGNFQFWRKTNSGWEGPFSITGDRGPVGPAATLLWVDAGWTVPTTYNVNNGLAHNGTSYRCHTAHVSSAATEPGVGVSWQSVWEVAAAKGDAGFKGWAPILSVVIDGQREVLQITDWTGGQGTKPATGAYLGATGLVTDIEDAVDVRGATGPQGPRGIAWRGDWQDAPVEYDISHVVVSDDSLGNPASWIALQPNTGSRPRDNPADWQFFPASFPSVLDDGLITDAVTETLDDGLITDPV